jgi:hypothetical protein
MCVDVQKPTEAIGFHEEKGSLQMPHYLFAAGASASMLYWLVSNTIAPLLQGLGHLPLLSIPALVQ